MATITGLTAARMIAMEAATIISGVVTNDNLILSKRDGTTVNAGNVRGPVGSTPVLRGVSVTSHSITTGSKVFAISPAMNVAFPVGATVKAQGAAAANSMVGLVTASSTTSVTVDVTELAGSGTFASWTLVIGSFRGTDGTVTGAAGGALAGTYPNPSLAAATQQLLQPTGAITMFGGATAPTGWLLCQGQFILRTDQQALFNVIGTAFNLGTDTDVTRFRLPDLRDRSPVGVSGTKALGSSGGSETKTIVATNLPPHSHTMAHDHTIAAKETGPGAQGGQVAQAGGAGVVNNANTAINTYTGNTGIGYAGTAVPLDVTNPYDTVNFIIKT